MPALYTLDRLRPEYVSLFDKMEISNSRRAAAKSQALKIISGKARYKVAAIKARVPWFVIGLIHFRESNGDFTTYLGNGDPIERTTIHVPRGRGPFGSWEDGAFDALVIVENLDDITYDGPEACAYAFEKINGWGYRNPGRSGRSPYLWGGTNLQLPGKFVSDGKYDPRVMDQQIGAMAVLRMLMDLDADVVFAGAAVPAPAPDPMPSPPLAPADPPNSPRADDTETSVKPLSKSKTIWSAVVQWFTSNTAMVFAYIDKHPEIVIGFVGLSSVCLFLVVTGRVDVQKILKHLSVDDTVKA